MADPVTHARGAAEADICQSRSSSLGHDKQGPATSRPHPASVNTARLAGTGDAGVVACLLDTFNRKFHTPTP